MDITKSFPEFLISWGYMASIAERIFSEVSGARCHGLSCILRFYGSSCTNRVESSIAAWRNHMLIERIEIVNVGVVAYWYDNRLIRS